MFFANASLNAFALSMRSFIAGSLSACSNSFLAAKAPAIWA